MKIKLPYLPAIQLYESRDKVKNLEKRGYVVNSTGMGYGNLLGKSQSTETSMQLSAVYAAVEAISNAMAALPFEPIRMLPDGSKEVDRKHSSYRLLNIAPNKLMSRFTFIKTLVVNVLLNGNGYIHIIRDGSGNPIELRLLNSPNVSMFITKDGSDVYYTYGKDKTIIQSDNMIHVLGFSYDGLQGISVLSHAGNSLSTASSADKQARNFFNNGSNMSGIMQVTSNLDDGQAEQIKSGFRQALSDDGGGIMVIGGDMEFMPISVSAADAQLLETRKFSVIEIARFFGISPVKLFDMSATTYSNIENAQLAFLTDTVSVWCEKIENEFARKLYRPSERNFLEPEFDITALLRADMVTNAEYLSKLFMTGAFTVNEIRKKVGNNVFDNDRANIPFIQSSCLPIDFDFKIKDTTDNKLKSDSNNGE